MAGRTPVVMPLAAAVASIPDGAVVGIGGFVTSNKPMALLRALMRRRARRLTVVAAGSLEIDMLLGLELVERLITPYCGAEALAPVCPLFGARAGRQVALEEVDLGTLAAMLRAQTMGLPFLPVIGPVGTAFPERNSRLKPLANPFGGPDLFAAAALPLDVALIHAGQADAFGNVQHLGAVFVDQMLARAARRVIVQVERLVPNETIRRAPESTTLPAALVDAIVVAPYGAHPFASHAAHLYDEAHLRGFVAASRALAAGDAAALAGYVARFIDGPADHAAYLEQVGVAALLGLALEGGGTP